VDIDALDLDPELRRWTLAWLSGRKRQRKPSIATLVKRAERVGKTVTSATVEGDKVVLTFDGSERPASDNPWDIAAAELRKGRPQ
jgi:hypothetical protein